MRQREPIAESTTFDGESLTLTIEHGEYVVRVRGETLMSARLSGSERAMAKLACDAGALRAKAHILVAGLGMGFTLREVLDRAAPDARISVIELFPDVIEWNRGPLAEFARRPLDDPRVRISVEDLFDYLTDHTGANKVVFDAILLDIDNGPEAFTVASNDRLYNGAGLALLHRALRDDGIMVVWSAFRSPAFEKRLRNAGFAARSVKVRARADAAKGARHTLFVASKENAVTGKSGNNATAPRTAKPRQRRAR